MQRIPSYMGKLFFILTLLNVKHFLFILLLISLCPEHVKYNGNNKFMNKFMSFFLRGAVIITVSKSGCVSVVADNVQVLVHILHQVAVAIVTVIGGGGPGPVVHAQDITIGAVDGHKKRCNDTH